MATHLMIKLFTQKELNDLYGIPEFTDEERLYFFTLSSRDQEILDSFKKLEDKIYFILSLGYFKAKNCLIKFTFKTSKKDFLYLIDTYFPKEKLPKQLPSPKQQDRIQNKILDYEKAIRLTKDLQKDLNLVLSKLIKRHPKARPLTKAFLDHLSRENIALPAYSTLQRLITRAIAQEKKRLFSICHQHIKPENKRFLENLLEQEESVYSITTIKQDVKDFNYVELKKEIKKHRALKPIFYIAREVLQHTGLPKKTIEYYGSLVNFYSSHKLSRMPEDQAHWYLLCYSFSRYQKVNDNLVQFFRCHVDQFHEESKAFAQEKLLQLQLELNSLLVKGGQVFQLFTETQQEAVSKEDAFKILPLNNMITVQDFLLGKSRDDKVFYWEHINSLAHQIRMYLRPLFLEIDFAASEETELNSVIAHMKALLKENKPFPKNDPTLIKFIPQKLRSYLLTKTSDNKTEILWDRFEFFFYKTIAKHLRTKKVFLSYSLNYKPLKEELIAEPIWKENKSSIVENLGYPKLNTPIETLLKEYHQELDPLIVSVNERIKNGDNPHVKLKQGKKGLHWTLPYQKKMDYINNPFFLQLPQMSIVDVLHFVDKKCNFLNSFTPIQSLSTKQERKDSLVLAAVLGNAIRLGTYKMASSGYLNVHELVTTEKTYVRLETLREAIDAINNETAKLSLFPHLDIHGKLRLSSLDGSKIGTRLHTLKSRYSPKYYGLEKGVASYNLITNHLPINAHIIGANEHESHFVFPTVYNNTSEINPLQHSGDGHSINQLNFTLFDFIGHQYMPHFPSIQKRDIYCFENPNIYKDCIIKPNHQVRSPLIINEWPQVQHIMASILQAETDQRSIIQILSSHDYHSKTKEALWEYDNILKSIYILNYIDDMEMRRAVRKALNRGESYHQLCRAIACINGGRFRGKSELELEIWNECARLIASAIIFYNTFILSLLLEQTEDENLRKIIKQISPVAWIHINFLGKYEFNKEPLFLEIEKWLKKIKIDSEFIH